MNLLRGAEYHRYYNATKREALTFYDLNLSAQDHQTFFTCDTDKDRVRTVGHRFRLYLANNC